jgi:hypothetical protein
MLLCHGSKLEIKGTAITLQSIRQKADKNYSIPAWQNKKSRFQRELRGFSWKVKLKQKG